MLFLIFILRCFSLFDDIFDTEEYVDFELFLASAFLIDNFDCFTEINRPCKIQMCELRPKRAELFSILNIPTFDLKLLREENATEHLLKHTNKLKQLKNGSNSLQKGLTEGNSSHEKQKSFSYDPNINPRTDSTDAEYLRDYYSKDYSQDTTDHSKDYQEDLIHTDYSQDTDNSKDTTDHSQDTTDHPQDTTDHSITQKLKEFIDEHFLSPEDEVEHVSVPELSQPCPFPIQNDELLEVTQALLDRWKLFSLKNKPINGSSTRLQLDNPFMVAGGRFQDFFYWDTWFILEGLIASGYKQLPTFIFLNCCQLIEEYGFIPNGTRKYFLNRSQPPFFCSILESLLKFPDLKETILDRGLNCALKELAYFEKYKSVEIDYENQTFTLFRYFVDTNYCRLESLKDDIATLEKATFLPENHKKEDQSRKNRKDENITNKQSVSSQESASSQDNNEKMELSPDANSLYENPPPHKSNKSTKIEESNKSTNSEESNKSTNLYDLVPNLHKKIFSSLKSSAESGIDFSNRWFTTNFKIETIASVDMVAVDLNSLMYKNYTVVARLYELKGDTQNSQNFREKAKTLERAINTVLWDRKSLCWVDYNFMKREKRNKGFFPSSFYPLFFGIEVPQQFNEFEGTEFESGSEFKSEGTEGTENENEGAENESNDKNKKITQYDILARYSHDIFEHVGGIPASYDYFESSESENNPNKNKNKTDGQQQWDFPNTWAPHTYLFFKYLLSLEKSSSSKNSSSDNSQTTSSDRSQNSSSQTSSNNSQPAPDLAFHVGKRYFDAVNENYRLSSIFYEKYTVSKQIGTGGEYTTQDGFGWTNAVALQVIKVYGVRLMGQYDVKNEYEKIQKYLNEKCNSEKENSEGESIEKVNNKSIDKNIEKMNISGCKESALNEFAQSQEKENKEKVPEVVTDVVPEVVQC